MYTGSNHKGTNTNHQYTGSLDESAQVVEDLNKGPELTIPPPPPITDYWMDAYAENTGIGNNCYALSGWVIAALTTVVAVVLSVGYWCASR